MNQKDFRKTEVNHSKRAGYHPEFLKRPLKLFEILIGFIYLFLPFAFLIIAGRYGYFELASMIVIILIISTWIFILLSYVVPLLWMLFKISKRTKNWNFKFQALIYTQWYITLVFLALAPLLIPLIGSNAYFLVFIPLILISVLILLIEFQFIRQPLLLQDADFTRNISKTKSTILSSSALNIDSIEDGYSQRATFLEVKALRNHFESSEDFRSLGTSYAEFLGKKGVIIDWKITDNAIKLYPRFLVQLWRLKAPWRMWQYLNNVRKQKNLTEVEITYNPPQISIWIAPTDYEMLGREVTFHTLGLKVLNRLGQSLFAFLNEDYVGSYNVLFYS